MGRFFDAIWRKAELIKRKAELIRREAELMETQTATDEEHELISKCVAHGCLDMGTHSADVDGAMIYATDSPNYGITPRRAHPRRRATGSISRATTDCRTSR